MTNREPCFRLLTQSGLVAAISAFLIGCEKISHPIQRLSSNASTTRGSVHRPLDDLLIEPLRLDRTPEKSGEDEISVDLAVTNRSRSRIAFCNREDFMQIEFTGVDGRHYVPRLKRFEDKMPVPGLGSLSILAPGKELLLKGVLGPQRPDLPPIASVRIGLIPCDCFLEDAKREIRQRHAKPILWTAQSEWRKVL